MKGQTSNTGATARALHDQAWSQAYELIDRQLSPLGLRAMDALSVGPGDTVLDIGCGAGQTLLQLAERIGVHGRVIGVDISAPLLEIANRRAHSIGSIEVIHADAQTLDLPTASVDAVFSRFGVMSFSDPIAAFANFNRILKPCGRLAFCCWRALEDNELDHFPLSAAGIDAPQDGAPFSFAEPVHIERTLDASGFGEITIQPHDEHVSSGDLDAMTAVLLKVGPLGKLVRETPERRVTAEPRLRAALAQRAAGGDPAHASLRAGVWIVTARSRNELR